MPHSDRDDAQMMGRHLLLGSRATIALVACATALALPASASAAHSVGTSEQISWIRQAALTFVTGGAPGRQGARSGVQQARGKPEGNHSGTHLRAAPEGTERVDREGTGWPGRPARRQARDSLGDGDRAREHSHD